MIVKVVFDDSEELIYNEKEYRRYSTFQDEILENIDRDIIEEYAEHYCNMTPYDELPRIQDFKTNEMILELKERGFIMIDPEDDKRQELDYVDKRHLKEITDKFLTGGWAEREELYRKIFE